MSVTNRHRMANAVDKDKVDCNMDYRGKIIFYKNALGLLNSNSIHVHGAEEVRMERNHIYMAADDAISMMNVKSFHMVSNSIGFLFNTPFLKVLTNTQVVENRFQLLNIR